MRRKYTEVEIEKLLKKYKEGNYRKTIFAREEKTSVNTLNKWLDKMDDGVMNDPKFIKTTVDSDNNQQEILKKPRGVQMLFEGYQVMVEEDTNEELLKKALLAVKMIC